MNNKFCFFVYTNEKYLPIADLTMGEFNKHYPDSPFTRYLVSNRIVDYNFETKNATFLDCNVPHDTSGRQFAKTMKVALNQIPEEYIIFFCDDYMLIDRPNVERLSILLNLIEEHKIDFFSFASNHPKPDWEKYDLNFPNLDGRFFYKLADNYQYHYSVQPCIWKKNSLLELLEYNPNISLHDLDTTNIKNREGAVRDINKNGNLWEPYPYGSQNFGFKDITTDFGDYNELNPYEFFIFPYVELIRYGFFNLWHNTNSKKFILNMIESKDLRNHEHLKKFIHES